MGRLLLLLLLLLHSTVRDIQLRPPQQRAAVRWAAAGAPLPAMQPKSSTMGLHLLLLLVVAVQGSALMGKKLCLLLLLLPLVAPNAPGPVLRCRL